jgi:hypothetical protein
MIWYNGLHNGATAHVVAYYTMVYLMGQNTDTALFRSAIFGGVVWLTTGGLVFGSQPMSMFYRGPGN